MAKTEFSVGDVVVSRAGRDKGRPFVILARPESEYALLVDGSLRRLERPKRKKLMHLMAAPQGDSARMQALTLGKQVCDADIRRHLAAHGGSKTESSKEG